MPKMPGGCKSSLDTLANGFFKAWTEAALKNWRPDKDDYENSLWPPSAVSMCNNFYALWVLEIMVL